MNLFEASLGSKEQPGQPGSSWCGPAVRCRELGVLGGYAHPFPQTTKPLSLFVSDRKAKMLTLDKSKTVTDYVHSPHEMGFLFRESTGT